MVPLDGREDWAEQWLLRLMPDHFHSKSSARKAVKRGEIAFDGQTVEHHCRVGPGVVIERLEPAKGPPAVFHLDLDVVYEDEQMAVVVKLPGFRVNGNRHRTIEHALPHNLEPTTAPAALQYPRPCHRLDAPTGGLLVVAKTGPALAELNRQFQARETRKTYRAIAIGRLEGHGRVEVPLDGREAISEWRVVRHTRSLRTDWITTVELHPITGRTHQLRRHLSGLGHPILGDSEYGIEGRILRGKGLFLWATAIEITVPGQDTPRRFETAEPHKFHSMRVREARRWRNHHDLEVGESG